MTETCINLESLLKFEIDIISKQETLSDLDFIKLYGKPMKDVFCDQICHYRCFEKEVFNLKKAMQILYDVCSKYEQFMDKKSYYAARNSCRYLLYSNPDSVRNNTIDFKEYFENKFELYFKGEKNESRSKK